jgi:hypothetical protein
MLLRWADIERELQDKGASANEINSKRQIFNNVAFQNILLTKFGFITENTFGMDSERLSVSKTTGTLDDLGKLDSYELIDYLECNEITYKQAATILPQQMALLGEDQIDKISNSLIEGLEDNSPISFALSHIVQTGFPYQTVKGKQHFERVNGALTVTMSAPNEIGLPSGIYPRLIFIHICSEIIKNQGNRHISLGHTLKKFVVDELGKTWTTGKRGSAKKWTETLTQILATSFTSTFKQLDGDGKVKGIELDNVSIAKKASLWWDDDYDENIGANIEVSESFAEVLMKHATPLDSRAIKELADLRSPLAIDLYCFLTYRYWRMEVAHSPITRITWNQLHAQMGTSIGTVSSFKKEVRKALLDVKRVYPSANFSADRDEYLVLVSSPPHISPARIPQQANLDF